MRKIATILAAIGFSFCAGGTVYAKTLAGPKSEQGGHHHRHSGTSTHGVGRHMRAGNEPKRHQAGIRHRSKRAETAPGAAPRFAPHAHDRHGHHFGMPSHHLDLHSHHGTHHAHGAHPRPAPPPLHRDHRKHSRGHK